MLTQLTGCPREDVTREGKLAEWDYQINEGGTHCWRLRSHREGPCTRNPMSGHMNLTYEWALGPLEVAVAPTPLPSALRAR